MSNRKRHSSDLGMASHLSSQPRSKLGKKVSALLLTVCMIVTMIPSAAFAAEENSDAAQIEVENIAAEDNETSGVQSENDSAGSGEASVTQPDSTSKTEDSVDEVSSDDTVPAEENGTFELQSQETDDLLAPPSVNESNILLRQTEETGSSYISFSGMTQEWADAVQSITLKPVNKDDSDASNADGYPNAPKEITLTKDQLTANVSGNRMSFSRTAKDPVVYVPMGHEPIDIKGWRGTTTYPQSQIYEVTVKANGYADAVGKVTYYTGTAPEFSIIVVDEGEKDGTTVKSWTAKELAEMATFANGSSQCGMTGFRSFNGLGVTLNDLLEQAGVTVSDSDYFLLDTSDHYGNKFTYDELFGTKRYFLESVYNDADLAKTYHELVQDGDDSAAGSTTALRRMLANKKLVEVEPRINVKYNETMISGDAVGNSAVPTEANTTYNDLVSYENQFRFFYGIKVAQDDVTLSFDTKGGSAVDSQLVKSHLMTSTENTTIKSSYWANSLVIYRGQGEEHKTEPSTAADKITKPADPTREGYTFAGWYTDEDCTAGNEFDFAANDGTVDEDTTLYAKWVRNSSAGSGGSGGSASTPSSSKVSIADSKNGTVKTSVSSAANGASVTITVTADNGYELDTLKVMTAGGKELSVKSSGDKYTFTMPSEAVTVTASFKPVDSNGSSETSFIDVTEGSYFKDAVAWAVKNGITTGVSATQFAPDQSCTRAQTVTFLWRAAGSPEPANTNNAFTDVKADAYYYKAVLWATEKGITIGTSDTTFSPDDTCTRGQIATFLYRFAQSPAAGSENVFVDVTSADYYNDAVTWAAENNITTGTSQNTFSPKNDCTRAQIVTFLYRYMV